MTIKKIILDIEGTIAPISFVKDELFPFFLEKLPSVLSQYTYPLTIKDTDTDPILSVLGRFPEKELTTKETIQSYLENLVHKDIKESNLKSLQGLIWENGYKDGDIKAPLFTDALISIQKWVQKDGLQVYIYSSGSIKAQKLLFGHVKENDSTVDINNLLSGYFDITTSGFKSEPSSYESILKAINATDPRQVLFLSDNPREVEAALSVGVASYIVDRPGNHELSQDDKKLSSIISDFQELKTLVGI